MRFRKAPEPAPPDHSGREFLLAQSQVKVVPVSASDAARAKTRRVAVWSAVVASVVAAAGISVWRSSRPNTAKADYQDAEKLYASGKYRDAVGTLDHAIGQQPNMIEAYRLRAQAERSLGEMDAALKDLNVVLGARPDTEAYRMRALTYRDLLKPAEALADYSKVIERQPIGDDYTGRGTCYRDLGQLDNAIRDFGKAIEMHPSVDTYLQRGMAYEAVGNHRAAIDDLDKAIEYRPEAPYSYRTRAAAREALGDIAGAKADRAKATEIETPHAIAKKG